ncbi:MAG: baseplate J/gp47 family protein [Ignavibacteriales bacterium]|nr:baseplate J/gp47 family protein [Ignavibacteriales bacterium]
MNSESGCGIKNPLVRDGSSQTQRLLKALKNDYVKIDERGVDDLLAFIYKYSGKIQFYGSDNQTAGSWKDFIENDISTTVALIAQKDLSVIKSCIDKNLKIINDSAALTAKVKAAFNNIFLHIFFITDEINSWYNRSVIGLRLNIELKQSITSVLRGTLQTVAGTYKYAKANGYLVDDTTTSVCSAHKYSGDFLASSLNNVWVIADTNLSWSNYLGTISPDGTLFGNETTDIKKIKYAAQRFETIVEKFIGAQSRIINLAPGFLEETLREYPSHEPHMSLFLAFLQLLDIAKKDLNAITKRHLDFYYRDVLQLEKNEEVPDAVHVIFQLAKQVDSYLIKEGTRLKAGKDETGVEVIYKVEEDTVINKAAIDQLKTIFVDKDDNCRVYSAPIANSKDGNGAEFDTDEPKWKTFGESQKVGAGNYLVEEERTMQFAEIGFAVTSPALFLNEGTRKIIVTFTASGTLPSVTLSASKFSAYLSTEKEWTETVIESVLIDSASNKISFTLSLGNEAPPVIAFNNTKLTDGFDSEFPVLKIILNNDASADYDYKILKDITVTGVTMSVEVDGMKNLILQNDAGLLKPNKPFYPFTTTPGIGSSFYIGGKEIFQKNLTYLKLDLEWKDVPDSKLNNYYAKLFAVTDNTDFKVQCSALINGIWETIGTAQSLFDSADAKLSHTIQIGSENGNSTDFDDYEPGLIEEELTELEADTQRGFMKLVLSEPADAFGHKLYRDAYTKAIIAYAQNPSDTTKANAIPKEPYTPFINSITLDYNSSETIDLQLSETYEENESKFYHLYPFGIKEVREPSTSKVYMLPQFEFDEGTKVLESEGELYIGIKDLNPPQNISILFQMAEGSADPELPKQEVYWSYLRNNKWVKFDVTEIISDTTDGLIKSGIIEFSIPSEAANDNSILPSGVHWIRAAVDQNSGAVCGCIEIIAQALKAVYVNNGNDTNFLAAPIAADTITGLKTKDASVKKASQPYSSLGGKTEESDEQFYTRVSERLRHKNRGVAIWDYEKLVLQEFPFVYKVKCINHSVYIPKASEFAPGYVSVIVIPNLLNKNAVDPLEPRASVGELNDIKEFLQTKISPFASETIQVLNPLYEKIKVEFKVQFNQGIDYGYYSKVLEEDIIKFLSPWAYGESSELNFGGIVYKSVILNFVEERDYVDFVTEFKMVHITEDTGGNLKEEYKDEIETTSMRSILVSNSTHIINEVDNC